MRLPDPQRSWAVIVGTGTYQSTDLPDVPAAKRNVLDLESELTHPASGILRRQQCKRLLDEPDPAALGRALIAAARAAEDLLLVYYTGHGLLHPRRHELHLSLPGTDPDALGFTAVHIDVLRDAIQESPAENRVLILDCCYSGRAITDALAHRRDQVLGQIEVSGTYTITAAPANRTAVVVPGEPYTAFTGRLLRVLRENATAGSGMTLGDIYRRLRSVMAADRLPTPELRGTGTADQLVFARTASAKRTAPTPALRPRGGRGTERPAVGQRGVADLAAVNSPHVRRSGKARVQELADELGLTTEAVLAKLKEMGEFVKSTSSTVEAPTARRLRVELASGPVAQQASAKQTASAKAAPPKLAFAGKARPSCPVRPGVNPFDVASAEARTAILQAADDLGTEEALLAAIDVTINYFNDGDVVAGTVVKIDQGDILLDVGYKAEGVIHSWQLSSNHGISPTDGVKVGDRVRAAVIQKEDDEGRLILSAQYKRTWARLEDVQGIGGIVRGVVIEALKEGLILDIGLRAFLPASLLEVDKAQELRTYVGRKLEAKIAELDRSRNHLVLSRRALLGWDPAAWRTEFLNELTKPQIRRGVVCSIVDFGAFVDLGGVEGMVHISELSWERVGHPSEVVHLGQELEVSVLSVDIYQERVSLSLKQTGEDLVRNQLNIDHYRNGHRVVTSEPLSAWEGDLLVADTPTADPKVSVDDLASEEAFLAAIDETIKYSNDGDIVEGTVTEVRRDEVLLDIGYKTEGVIPSRELSIKHDVDPSEVVSPGDHIEALVLQKEDKEGRLILSKKRAQYERAWGTIEDIKEKDGVVRGAVIEVVKGGLILDIGLRGFLPASLVEMRRVRDLQPYVGRELEAKIIELDKNRNNVVLSRRAWLEQTQSEVRTEFLNKLAKGQVRKGVVSSIVADGAFVDLGGVDGLVHVSELSWKHIDHPSEVVEVGQEVEVEVLSVEMDRERVSLSLKATQEDPWRQFARTHAIQQIVPGKVTKLVPFGAFVRVEDGIEGLVHISELAEKHVEIPEQVVQVGSDVMVKVIDIDLERRRISLSLKQANEGFVEGEEYFDPTLYGMSATYDAEGNYIYPDGFDPETGDWLPGHEQQREEWEQQYAAARERWQAHARQVAAMRPAGRTGTLATDEALAALKAKLADF